MSKPMSTPARIHTSAHPIREQAGIDLTHYTVPHIPAKPTMTLTQGKNKIQVNKHNTKGREK